MAEKVNKYKEPLEISDLVEVVSKNDRKWYGRIGTVMGFSEENGTYLVRVDREELNFFRKELHYFGAKSAEPRGMTAASVGPKR